MSEAEAADMELGRRPRSIPHWKVLADQGVITDEMLTWKYDGKGTQKDPYIVYWIDNDPRNPYLYSKPRKYLYTLIAAIAPMIVSFSSSSFAGGFDELIRQYAASRLVVNLSLSLFVIGWAVGPLVWAPLSEMYGRQKIYFFTFGIFVAFNLGVTMSQNIWSILTLRFLAGCFGAGSLANGGGVVSDLFDRNERGTAATIFSFTPYLGSIIGPIVGSFVGEGAGWRWVSGVITISTGMVWILGSIIVPETYLPVLLRRRAEKLSKTTGDVYISRADMEQGQVIAAGAFKTAFSRPWILLLHEPIVLLLSVYTAIIFGTIYLLFLAIPAVFVKTRGWSSGMGSLAFVGVGVGMTLAVWFNLTVETKVYQKLCRKHGGSAPQEARLVGSMLGGCSLPIALFWFAWTNHPTLPWQASVAATIPFGFGMILVITSINNYLIDSYTIFTASVLAANLVLRSIFAASFVLFTTQMYDSLGIHWASTIPAFLALACAPLPFIFYKYGQRIRRRCKFAAEAEAFLEKIRGKEAVDDAEHSGMEAQEDELRGGASFKLSKQG